MTGSDIDRDLAQARRVDKQPRGEPDERATLRAMSVVPADSSNDTRRHQWGAAEKDQGGPDSPGV